MLVLCRKAEESIVVDGRITFTILKVKGNKVQVGIDAPDDVGILRAELEQANAALDAKAKRKEAQRAPILPERVERIPHLR